MSRSIRCNDAIDSISAKNKRNVELLLKAGAKIDPDKDDVDMSPLAFAAELSQYDIVHTLITMGADINVPSADNRRTIAESLLTSDLDMIIEADIADEQERSRREQELRKWYYRVLELIEEKRLRGDSQDLDVESRLDKTE